RGEERLLRLRGGDLAAEAREVLELALAPLARRVRDERVDVVGEELERPALAVLLAHEEERRLRCEEQAGGAERELVGGRAVADRAVPDLVVVLRAVDEALRGRSLVLAREPFDGPVP